MKDQAKSIVAPITVSLLAGVFGALAMAPATALANAQLDVDGVFELSLDELLSLEVTSASKRSQKLMDVAAAIHVITQEDIRRIGATNIPEALRLVPGMNVASINANTWAISSRGFNSLWANKLLVLVDGRSVYVPSYSGVFWDQLDLLMPDIDRIEVIRGPGATVWGANAVNGIINIITRNASDTKGVYVGVRASSGGRSDAQLRVGGDIGEKVSARAYLKFQDTQGSENSATGQDAGDDWRAGTVGFRIDAAPNELNRWKLQGDFHDTSIGPSYDSIPQGTPPYSTASFSEFDASGWNILAAWSRKASGNFNTSIQLYYDHVERHEHYLGQDFDTFDLEAKQEVDVGERHTIQFGAGYRHIREEYDNTFAVSVTPDSYTQSIESAFIQDEISLVAERLKLLVGAKIENNNYTGSELQPNIRLITHLDNGHTLWAAASRAARTPSRLESNGNIVIGVIPVAPPPAPPATFSLVGNPELVAEQVVAYEVGYRGRLADNLSVDLTAYANEYDDLIIGQPDPTFSSLVFDNNINAKAWGFEGSLDWYPMESWRIHMGYSYLDIDGSADSGLIAPEIFAQFERASPRHQYLIRSTMDLGSDWSVDAWAYWISDLEISTGGVTLEQIDSRASANLRFAKSIGKGLRVAIYARDLIGSKKVQFVNPPHMPTTPGTSIYAEIIWNR